MRKFAVVMALLGAGLLAFVVWSRRGEPIWLPRDSARDKDTTETKPEAEPSLQATEAERSNALETPILPGRDPAELRGRVVMAGTTTPIAGAVVVLRHREADEFHCLDHLYREETNTLGQSTTSVDGRFRFEVARASLHRLEVRANGYAPEILLDRSGGAEVLVELSRGGVVEGTVRSDGTSAAAVPIRVVIDGIEVAKCLSGEDGAFRLEGLPPGEGFAETCSPRHVQDTVHFELESGATCRVELETRTGMALRGRVIDVATRLPIAGAQVGEEWSSHDSLLTDADGRFAVEGIVTWNMVAFTVRKDGYASTTVYVDRDLNSELELALARGAEVTGRIVDGAGHPLSASYAGVAAADWDGFSRLEGHDWVRANVAVDGRFVAKGLRPALDYWLMVRCPRFGTRIYALPRRLSEGERLDVGTVVMRAAGGIEGLVTDGHGLPVPDASIEVAGANADCRAWVIEKPPPRSTRLLDAEASLFDLGDDATPESPFPGSLGALEETFHDTDSNGCFRFTGLASGEYRITVRLDRRGHFQTRTITVSDGEIAEGVKFVVPSATVLEGKLRYSDGRALGDEAAKIRLDALADTYIRFSVHPDSGGRFRFQAVDDGYHYRVFAPNAPRGWAMRPLRDVVGGTRDLDLVLEPAAFVSGHVVDARGVGTRARVWASTYLVLGTCEFESHMTAQDGSFCIEVPPGFSGSIMASTGGNWNTQSRSDVTAGRSDVYIQLPSGH